MSILVRNKTEYDTKEVRQIVRQTLRDLDADDVAVTVYYSRSRPQGGTGYYREWWYAKKEDRPQIRVGLPKPHVTELGCYVPYERKRDRAPTFSLRDWREVLVAITAHEGMHHRQTPRNYYRSSRQAPGKGNKHRYVESECDWAAYRAVMRFRES